MAALERANEHLNRGGCKSVGRPFKANKMNRAGLFGPALARTPEKARPSEHPFTVGGCGQIRRA